MSERVLVFGHSLVRDLNQWMKDTSSDFLSGHQSYIHGKGGRTTELLKRMDMHVIRRFRPHVVFIQVGGNDITPEASVKDIAENLIELAVEIQQQGVSQVIIGSVIIRLRPRNMSVSQYDNKRTKINKHLSEKTPQTAGIKFWSHKCFRHNHLRDGVHLNDKGNEAFFFSIRHAMNSVTYV
ncbi:Hypothetical predicted protein [Mytilus galloprovincialis]|uniref:SGNH hydrolase-type esterase domain-containing protein n=1 Tax=Mytilus galloprovincialis TaxID=29158 RepID=A0A8B6CPE6_MYTGA|nr:Hypothetical predicted protein [Mytilus galloprovincialis]